MIASPCAQCEFRKRDKRLEPCTTCDKRFAYADGLLDMRGSVPDHMTDWGGRQDKSQGGDTAHEARLAADGAAGGGPPVGGSPPTTEDRSMGVRTCKVCGKEKDLVDGFYKVSGKGSGYFDKTCKTCRNKASTERKKAAKQGRSGHPKKASGQSGGGPPADTPPAVDRSARGYGVVTLDFAGNEDLLEAMHAWAETEFRTLEQQILYFLSGVYRRTPEMQRGEPCVPR